MQLANTETIPGHTILEAKGLVSGNTIRAKNLGRDIGAGLKNLVGGEIKGYQRVLEAARSEAQMRMIEQAVSQGATAIVNVCYETSQVGNPQSPTSEILCYGTMIKA